MQVLNYKHNLIESHLYLTKGHGDLFDSFSPHCAVIIGNAENELIDKELMKSFELYRNQLQEVCVFTFDELFEKTKSLVTVLEKNTETSSINFAEDYDIPF